MDNDDKEILYIELAVIAEEIFAVHAKKDIIPIIKMIEDLKQQLVKMAE